MIETKSKSGSRVPMDRCRNIHSRVIIFALSRKWRFVDLARQPENNPQREQGPSVSEVILLGATHGCNILYYK